MVDCLLPAAIMSSPLLTFDLYAMSEMNQIPSINGKFQHPEPRRVNSPNHGGLAGVSVTAQPSNLDSSVDLARILRLLTNVQAGATTERRLISDGRWATSYRTTFTNQRPYNVKSMSVQLNSKIYTQMEFNVNQMDKECCGSIEEVSSTPTIIDIPVRQRLSEFAFRNPAIIEKDMILSELSLVGEYLSMENSGIYSTKVFLGGLPHDAEAHEIREIFGVFGHIKTVEWPDSTNHPTYPPNGFAFIVFYNERSVHHLLNYTKKDANTGSQYIWFKSRSEVKPIEIRPWRSQESTYVQKGTQLNRPKNLCEVFIGGIPRSFTAVQLAGILEDNLKLNVFSVVIDVDNTHRYPKGTAKVTFSDTFDAWKAISINKVSLRIGNQLKHMEIKLFKRNTRVH